MTSGAPVKAKQPFEAIQEAEGRAADLLHKEEERMKKELATAKERHAQEEGKNKQQITNEAMQELKQAKDQLGERLNAAMKDAEREAEMLEKKARERMPALMNKLSEGFFSLTA